MAAQARPIDLLMASLLVAGTLAGCDALLGIEDPAIGGDAGGGDGGGATGPIRVSVHDDQGAPQAGHPVFLHDPAGQLLADTETDADGFATFEDVAGGTVTAVDSFGGFRSWFGSKPGDDLAVGRPDPAPPVHDATVTVTLPGPHPGATHYEIAWGCIRNNVTDPSVPQTFSVVDDCASYPRLDLLALAFDVQAGDLVAFAQQWVDPLEDGNHVVEIFNWDTSFSTAQFTLENTPADISQVSAVFDI